MISVHLKGRMGNNLFQVGIALSLAAKFKTACHYAPSAPCLNCFELPDAKYSTERGSKEYSQYKFNFNEEFLNLTDDTRLDGYFQSPKYLDKELIKRNFKFKKEIDDKTKPFIVPGKTIGLHVRRGDYLGIQHAHPVCSMEYYKQCLEEAGDGRVLVFSDDLDWCRANFCGDRYRFIDLDEQASLCLMTKVDCMIIANSTFSWWGAYLNENKDAKIFCPKKWFGDTLPYRAADINLENCIKDLFPPEWIKR
jgi:Glycosyl transferase family 11